MFVRQATTENTPQGEAALEAGRLLFSPREAAAALNISARTLWSLTARGELPAVRIGRSVRYDMRDLRAFVDRAKRAG